MQETTANRQRLETIIHKRLLNQLMEYFNNDEMALLFHMRLSDTNNVYATCKSFGINYRKLVDNIPLIMAMNLSPEETESMMLNFIMQDKYDYEYYKTGEIKKKKVANLKLKETHIKALTKIKLANLKNDYDLPINYRLKTPQIL